MCLETRLNRSQHAPPGAGDHVREIHGSLRESEERRSGLEKEIATMRKIHESELKNLQEEINENLSQEHRLELENLRFSGLIFI